MKWINIFFTNVSVIMEQRVIIFLNVKIFNFQYINYTTLHEKLIFKVLKGPLTFPKYSFRPKLYVVLEKSLSQVICRFSISMKL